MNREINFTPGSEDSKMKRNSSIIKILFVILLSFSVIQCSAFQIRHTNDRGETRTYITDTIFVGTGTALDCIVGPLHWMAGFFYMQSYIHIKGGNLSYPRFGGSGCFFSGYTKGRDLLSSGLGTGIFDLGFLREGSGAHTQVYFVDTDKRERVLTGGTFEITRISPKVNFQMK